MSETKKCISTLDMEKVSAILLDVAGTTTAISFVKETLYPYVTKNAEEFLKNSWENEDVKKAIAKLEEKDLDVTKATEVIKNLTEKDDSNEGLKTIQGMLLKKGYESGDLKGHIFADVPKFFNSWSISKKLAIFSSGSVESQQLLFKNSTEGDLSPHVKKYFDLSLGSKIDSETYKKIAKELEVAPVDILFLTDDAKEAEAAHSADVNVVLVEREGNAPLTEESQAKFAIVKSFADISVEKMKRKIVEASAEEPPTKVAKVEINAVSDGIAESAKNDEVNKEPEEKKETETGVEAMEVDEEPIVTEKVEGEENPTEDVKSKLEPAQEDKNEKTETIELKPEEAKPEDKPEAMEVDSKKVELKTDEPKTEATNKAEDQKQNPEEQTNKADIEIGTQTKCAVTNECETQTTISIAAVDELPIKEVQDKLMATKAGATEEPVKAEKSEKKEEEKQTEPIEEMDANNVDEVKKTENVEKTSTDKIEDKIENKKDDDVQEEIKEVQAGSKDEIVKTEEESDKVKEDIKKDVDEEINVKANGDVCEKVEDESKAEKKEIVADKKEIVADKKEIIADKKEIVADKKEIVADQKEIVADKKEIVADKEEIVADKKENGDDKKENGPQENGSNTPQENGVKDKTVETAEKEKENKSQLANGKECEVPNGEASEPTNGENGEEIKVKKIGDKVESAAVSVEA